MGNQQPQVTKVQLGYIREIEYGFRVAEITIQTKKKDTDKLLFSLLEDRHPDIKRLANIFVVVGDLTMEKAESLLSSINEFLRHQNPSNQDIVTHLINTIGHEVVPLLDIINKN